MYYQKNENERILGGVAARFRVTHLLAYGGDTCILFLLKYQPKIADAATIPYSKLEYLFLFSQE